MSLFPNFAFFFRRIIMEVANSMDEVLDAELYMRQNALNSKNREEMMDIFKMTSENHREIVIRVY